MGGRGAGGQRGRGHEGAGRGEGPEQTGVVGELWPRSVGGEAGQELLEGRLEDGREEVVAPGEAGQGGQGREAGWREQWRDGGQAGLGGSQGGGEGGGGQQRTHRTYWRLEGSSSCCSHQAQGGVRTGYGGCEGAHGRSYGGRTVGGVGETIGTNFLIFPPLGATVLEPDLNTGLSQTNLHGQLLSGNNLFIIKRKRERESQSVRVTICLLSSIKVLIYRQYCVQCPLNECLTRRSLFDCRLNPIIG